MPTDTAQLELDQQLLKAVENANEQEVKRLILAGADPTFRNQEGKTLYEICVQLHNDIVIERKKQQSRLLQPIQQLARNIRNIIAPAPPAQTPYVNVGKWLSPQVYWGQNYIMTLMQALGYQANTLGVCDAVEVFANQAGLIGEGEVFDERIRLISKIMAKSYIKAEIPNKVVRSNQYLTDEEKNRLFNTIGAELKTLQKTQGNQYWDIRAFCDRIEAWQKVDKHSDIAESKFGGNIYKDNRDNNIRELLSSDKLKEFGGQANIGCTYGVYTKEEMEKYFTSLEEIFNNPPAINQRISLRVCGDRHVINIIYDPSFSEGKKWKLNNANALLDKPRNAAEVAEIILGQAHPREEKLSEGWLNINFACLRDPEKTRDPKIMDDNVQDLKERIIAWQHVPDMVAMHSVTEHKAQYKSNQGTTWLHLAVYHGEEELTGALLRKGARLHKSSVLFNDTPLEIAIENGHPNIVKQIHKNSFFINRNPKRFSIGVGLAIVGFAATVISGVLTGGLSLLAIAGLSAAFFVGGIVGGVLLAHDDNVEINKATREQNRILVNEKYYTQRKKVEALQSSTCKMFDKLNVDSNTYEMKKDTQVNTEIINILNNIVYNLENKFTYVKVNALVPFSHYQLDITNFTDADAHALKNNFNKINIKAELQKTTDGIQTLIIPKDDVFNIATNLKVSELLGLNYDICTKYKSSTEPVASNSHQNLTAAATESNYETATLKNSK